MNRYVWIALGRDGVVTQRWNEDGSENVPSPDTKEFHLLPERAAYERGLRPFSLFLKDGQRLVYRKRRHADAVNGAQPVDVAEAVTYLVGFEEDHDFAHFSCYAQLLPDGRIEWSSDYNHITEHERNLDEHPPRLYERWNPAG